VRALLIRIAKRINRMMGVRGPRFADRYHERALTGPTQVRNALRYVIHNHARHLAQVGKVAAERDEFCSDAHPELTVKPKSWLLRVGWQRAGPA